jgi:DNA excision repair protein ERCC-3
MTTCHILLADNLYAEVIGSDTYTLRALKEGLTYRPKGYVFTGAYRAGYWDGQICLLKRGRFPVGLVEHVRESLKLSEIELEVEDRRTRPQGDPDLFPLPPTIKLKDYQEKAVAAACAAGRGVIHHPVGSGKTHVLLEVVRRLGVPALALVHRKDLLYQLHERARDIYKMEAGIIGDGQWVEAGGLTVATFQTIYRRLRSTYDKADMQQWLRRFRAVHVDEAHHVEAETYEYVMQHLPNAYYRFGYSATPFRSGDKGTFLRVVGWTGPVVSHLPSAGGIKAGRLVPADIFIISPTASLLPIDLDWPTAYETGIVKHARRNEIIVRIAQAMRVTGPVLILVERLEHGAALARALDVPFLSGSATGQERMDKWEDMRQGRADCLVASVIADEGLDIPNIATLILAGGGRAPHRMIQRIGRGMRKSAGKDRLDVFDFADRGYYLGRHYKSRRRAYDRESAYVVAEVRPEELDEWLKT